MSKFNPCVSCHKRDGLIWIVSDTNELLPFCGVCEPENLRLFTANEKEGQNA